MLSVPLILMLLFFLVNQLALWGSHSIPITDTSSMMEAKYDPWLYDSFPPVDKSILNEIENDSGFQINDPQPNETQGWFWESSDDDRTPTPTSPSRTPTASPTASATPIPTDTPTPTNTATSTNTLIPPIPPPSPTPINAELSITKTLTSAGAVENGNPVTYEIVISNTGAEMLSNVQITDDLDNTFGAGTYSNVTISTTGYLTANGAYNGSSNTNLLVGNEALPVGYNETITISLQIDTVSGGIKTNTANSRAVGVISGKNVSKSDSATVSVISTQLLVSKTRTSGFAVPNGSTVVFSIVVTNAGNDDLDGIQVTDDLSVPFGAGNYSITSVTTTGILTPNGGYNGVSNTNLLIPNQTLLVGATETITLTVQLNTVTGGIKINTADASGTGATLGIIVNASDDAMVNVLPPDISVTKTRTSAASVPNGSTVVYSIVVTNTGDETLNNVQVIDNLDTTFGAGNYTVSLLNISAGSLFFNGGYTGSSPNDGLLLGTQSLAVGSSQTITLSVQIISVPAVLRTNTANASGTAAASAVLVISSNSATVTVLPPAISVSKTRLSSSTVANGGTVTYSILVSNTGDETLNNVQVTDNLNTTFGSLNYNVLSVSATGTLTSNWPGFNGSSDTDLLSGTDTLAVGASSTITLSVQINTVIGGVKTNTANATAIGLFSSFPVSDSDPATVTVQPPAISVTKTRTSAGSVPNGSTVVFSIVVSNTGAEDLNNVQVTDNLNTTFGSLNYNVLSITETGPLTANGGYNGSTDTDLLSGTDSLAVGASSTITLSVRINTVTAGLKTNTANADGTAAVSSFPVSDSDPATVTVQPPAISVTKTRTSAGSVPNGSTIVFSIVVSNTGAEDLNNVQVTDNLNTTFGSLNYTVISVTETGPLTANGGYDGSTDTDLLNGTDSLAVGASSTITLSVQINTVTAGLKTNTANADGTAAVSSFPVSDSDPATVTVQPPAISVTKTRTSAGSVPNGSTIVFSIVVSNTGAEDLNNVQVTDNLNTTFGSLNYTVISVTETGPLTANGGYDGSTDTDLLNGTDSLAVGASSTITLSVQITTVTGGTKTNTADVEGWGFFSNFYVSDSNSDNVTVLAPAISVTKTLTSSSTVANGGTVSYSIVVTNTGAEILNNVQVTDSLDAAFGAGTYSNVNVSAGGGLIANPGYSGTGNLLDGTQPLGIGASATITVSLQIDTVTGGTKTNTANASGTGAVSGFVVNALDSATVTVAGSLFCPSATLTNFTAAGSTVSWDVNNGGASFNIINIFLGWPATNGNLTLVTLNGNTIWSGSDAPLTASITPSGNTTVGTSNGQPLVFTFASTVNPTNYSLIVTTNVPCVLTP